MYTSFSSSSRNPRIFFQISDATKEVPENIDTGKRNVIKLGLTGLLVVATATSAINVLAKEIDKEEGQTVETVFGRLSFAQIQKHEKKDEILGGLKPSKQVAYHEWEGQIATEEGSQVSERIKKLTNERIRLELEAIAKMKIIVAGGGMLKKEYESLVIKYATTPPPDKNALYIQQEAKKRQVFA